MNSHKNGSKNNTYNQYTHTADRQGKLYFLRNKICIFLWLAPGTSQIFRVVKTTEICVKLDIFHALKSKFLGYPRNNNTLLLRWAIFGYHFVTCLHFFAAAAKWNCKLLFSQYTLHFLIRILALLNYPSLKGPHKLFFQPERKSKFRPTV